ncbi:hypothetical protein FHR81_001661 [Actinoalloteichus hoggarensis]|uniref:hypothetical protein n=1 Tax=Actinoalloteichus hoggarensis TaxID=1470176 RepID=UPI0012FD7AE8|nr:hypothetical protein [Actinoalloteichus hoggarensis]MBB5920631.1 hypothetical protein [Actinoalloteichus hoggarensis]
MFAALEHGKSVGHSGIDRTVYEVVFKGERRRIAITVRRSGLMVGAHPISIRREVRPRLHGSGCVSFYCGVVAGRLKGEGPFYRHGADPEEYGHSIEEAAESLSCPDLVDEIRDRDAEYQATYDPDGYVWSKSGFDAPELEEAWWEHGKVSAARNQQESPVVAGVDYRAEGAIDKGTCMF